MDYKDTLLTNEDDDFKDLYSSSIELRSFLSFFETEEDNDCMILCTEYNIKGYLEYCHGTPKKKPEFLY
eukprot:10192352-Ditylum_brightwellii.AAC.1